MNSSIWPIDGTPTVLPLQVKVDLGVMEIKGYSTFPKTFPIRWFRVIPRKIVGSKVFYPSAVVDSEFSTASTNKAVINLENQLIWTYSCIVKAKWICIFTTFLVWSECNKVIFLMWSGVELVWILCFPSPRRVAKRKCL